MAGLFARTPKKKLNFILIDKETEAEKAVEILVDENITPIQLKKLLFGSFPILKDEEKYYLKGVYEGTKDGVFKPIDRVHWQFVPENTNFYLDVEVGSAAGELNQQKKKREQTKKDKEATTNQVVRQRWAEGYRKCSRCLKMYLIQQNGENSCVYVETGFSPDEGVYKKPKVGLHLQAKAKLDEYNDIVRDIRTVGNVVTRGIGLGTEGIGLVDHAKEGGSLGATGENINGWTPDDFENIIQKTPSNNNNNNNAAPGDGTNPDEAKWCQIM